MAQLLSELAPALDNLDLALEALAGSAEIEPSLIKGLEATRRAINDALHTAGVLALIVGDTQTARTLLSNFADRTAVPVENLPW